MPVAPGTISWMIPQHHYPIIMTQPRALSMALRAPAARAPPVWQAGNILMGTTITSLRHPMRAAAGPIRMIAAAQQYLSIS